MPQSEKRDESWMRALMKSRVERLNNGGGAMQASTIGFVLAGSIAAGFFAGSWLDARFKTGFWMPLLTLLGVFGGFYQMFAVLKQIDQSAQREDAAAKKNRAASNAKVASAKAAKPPRAARFEESDTMEPATPKPRIFAVPPPPTASFDRVAEATTETPRAENLRDNEDEMTLTERLLDDDSATPR